VRSSAHSRTPPRGSAGGSRSSGSIRDPSRADPVAFLRAHPVSYPSWYDKSGALGERITDSSFTPVTVFLARDGKLSYIHQGQYVSLQKLEEDIKRYALNA